MILGKTDVQSLLKAILFALGGSYLISDGGGGGSSTAGTKVPHFVEIVPDADVTVPVTATAYSFVVTDGAVTVGGVPIPLNVPVTGTGPLAAVLTIVGGTDATGLLVYETFS